MPIYEYECMSCGHRFEIFHRSGDTGTPSCTECRSEKISRIISPAGFVLKGSGWYATDYPSQSRKKAIEKEKKESKPPEPKKDTQKSPTPVKGTKSAQEK